MIMQGFVGFTIPIWLRRLTTMLPAFAIVGLGADGTTALVISQVVLSLALPLPMAALVMFTRRGSIMGRFANSGPTHIAAIAGTILVLSLDTLFLLQMSGFVIIGLTGAG